MAWAVSARGIGSHGTGLDGTGLDGNRKKNVAAPGMAAHCYGSLNFSSRFERTRIA